MGPSSRRFVAGLIRVALVVLAIVLVGGWLSRRMWSSHHRHRVQIQREAPPSDSLGPGDLRIYNTDSSVDLILQGDKILAGLSPKEVAKIRHDIDSSTEHDTSQLAQSISQIVRKSVAGAIGTHAVYPLSAMQDITYENSRIVIHWKGGGTQDVFGSTRVNGNRASNTFRPEDAERFVQAVRARLNMPEETPNPPTPMPPRPPRN